jgi:hypothetical protein
MPRSRWASMDGLSGLDWASGGLGVYGWIGRLRVDWASTGGLGWASTGGLGGLGVDRFFFSSLNSRFVSGKHFTITKN